MNKASVMAIQLLDKCEGRPSAHQLATLRWLATLMPHGDVIRIAIEGMQ